MTVIRMIGTQQGGHVHVQVFSAYQKDAELDEARRLTRGKNGELILTVEEWADLERMCESQTFGLHALIETARRE